MNLRGTQKDDTEREIARLIAKANELLVEVCPIYRGTEPEDGKTYPRVEMEQFGGVLRAVQPYLVQCDDGKTYPLDGGKKSQGDALSFLSGFVIGLKMATRNGRYQADGDD